MLIHPHNKPVKQDRKERLPPFRRENTAKGEGNLPDQHPSPSQVPTRGRDASRATLMFFPLNSSFLFFLSALIWVQKTGSPAPGQAWWG